LKYIHPIRNQRFYYPLAPTLPRPRWAPASARYKRIARESYSCTPECQPCITLGDGKAFFSDTIGQAGAFNGAAQGGGAAAGPSPAALQQAH
jgi:hypothetical protein